MNVQDEKHILGELSRKKQFLKIQEYVLIKAGFVVTEKIWNANEQSFSNFASLAVFDGSETPKIIVLAKHLITTVTLENLSSRIGF